MVGAFMRLPIGLLIVPRKRCSGSSSRDVSSNGVYSTPANQLVEYEITDPRGTKVTEGKQQH